MAGSKGRQRPKMTFSGPADPPKPVGQPAPETPALAAAPPQAVETGKPRQQSRIGKRAVTFYVSPEAFRQLRVLSAQTDKSIQLLMVEALDWQFQQHDMHRIAKE